MNAAIVFAAVVFAVSFGVVFYIIVGDLVDRRRKRLAHWEARTLVGMHSSEVQIQLVYRSRRGREYVMKRQSIGSVYAADQTYDEQVQKMLARAHTRAFDMNMGG